MNTKTHTEHKNQQHQRNLMIIAVANRAMIFGICVNLLPKTTLFLRATGKTTTDRASYIRV